jgi:glycosyltransferase involved in cell wall biosynthesis
MTAEVTPLVLTFNETPNIERTLSQLTWAKRIVVLDSFSTDATLEIIRKFPQVEIVQRQFDTFATQCNFGLTQIRTPWVLSLDADYFVTDELNQEIASLQPPAGVTGFSARFTYCIYGRSLRASLYPPRIVLYRREAAKYHDEGHGHRVTVSGDVACLHAKIHHDDRKPLHRWLAEQNRYAQREAEHLLCSPKSELKFPDRLRRKIWIAPFVVFFYTLLAKGLILDGWPGWYYVAQRTYAELLLSLYLLEAKLARAESDALTDR